MRGTSRMRGVCAAAVIAAVSACAGGHGTTVLIAHAGAGAAPQQRTTATFTIRVPTQAKTASGKRRTFFISPNTGSLRILLATVNGSAPVPAVPDQVVPLTPASPGCLAASGVTTCTVTAAAIIGADTYGLKLYASTDGSGPELAVASASATVVQGVAASVSVTFAGEPASVVFSRTALSVPQDGATHHVAFTLSALDASGATIVQPGDYAPDISLAISNDPNHALSLDITDVTAPGATSGQTTITLTDDASRTLTSGTITATVGSTVSTLAVNALIFSPASVRTLFTNGTAHTVTVSEAGYGGAYTITGAGVVTTSCVPVNCTPATPGAPVAITLTPGASSGRGTLAIADANTASASIPFGVGDSTPAIIIPTASLPNVFGFGIASQASSGLMFVGGGANIFYFDPRLCTTSCAVGNFAYNYHQSSDLLFGSDGNLYVQASNTNGVGKVTMPGCPSTCSQTQVRSGANSGGEHIIQGDDGALWQTTFSATVGRLTTAGSLTTFTFTGYTPNFITAAADGTLWFTNDSTGGTTIGHFDPNACTTACAVTSYALTHATATNGITIDASGNVWTAERNSSWIAELVCTPACTMHEYNLGSNVTNISFVLALPDGLIYGNDINTGRIDIIDPAACSAGACTLALQTTANFPAVEAAVGSDGNLWADTASTRAMIRMALP